MLFWVLHQSEDLTIGLVIFLTYKLGRRCVLIIIYFLNSMASTFKKTTQAPLKPTRKARSELTEEQKQEIKEAFDLFDTDGTGTFKT